MISNDNSIKEKLGKRVCIIGCTGSGKSTLAKHIENTLKLPATHLDFLAHHHDSNWIRCSDSELTEKHATTIAEDKWVIEGNYSICMPERFKRASSIIWLDLNPLSCTLKYLLRCLRSKDDRPGKLPGSKREFSIAMLKHIVLTYPKNRKKYAKITRPLDIPIITICTTKELNQLVTMIKLGAA